MSEVRRGVGAWYAPGSKAMIGFGNLNVRMLRYVPWRGLIGGAPQKVARTISLDDPHIWTPDTVTA